MMHAEGNDTDAATRMLQIWFEPNVRGGEAAFFERQLPETPGRHVVAGDEAMPLRADAKVEWIELAPAASITLQLPEGRAGYLLGLLGKATSGTARIAEGDGADVSPGEATWTSEDGASLLWITMGGGE